MYQMTIEKKMIEISLLVCLANQDMATYCNTILFAIRLSNAINFIMKLGFLGDAS